MAEPASTFLLDTHVLAWWLNNARQLAAAARAAIAASGSAILVSTASVWEMAQKHRRGRWPEIAAFLADPGGILRDEHMRVLPIELAHTHAAGALDWVHGDPFDRMLAAQAIIERATLVTADRGFATAPAALGLEILWA